MITLINQAFHFDWPKENNKPFKLIVELKKVVG
jgi:hypothetical protein